MKLFQLTASLLGIVLVGVGAATALTNPGEAAYEEYATQRLTEYLQESACSGTGIALQSSCSSLIQENRSQIQKLISANTQRQNFVFLSIYKTELAPGKLLPDFLSNLLPAYHFETAGVLNSFHIYRAEKQGGS
ncbi:DUF4359 domain-containing protein [Phormidium tenue FACHB-886]|nr:DUF4359 domain-containing protein [Phormidium tenue FACHB-886]